ncbi:MAG: VacB/RNase II family 3'-5' exoribonuclease [Candidatus Sumerlaeaceae bacterium]|nr:VacB/RNase II family 3'-5' exoribonuclease [Candidatus Sumerlaeaceae bacterium]
MLDELKDRIRHILRERAGRPIKITELVAELGLAPSDRKRLRRVMREMAADEGVAGLRGQQYALPTRHNTIIGLIRTSQRGFGFVVPDEEFLTADDRREIFVPRKRMGDAMHNDKVRVRIVADVGKSPEGQVLDVLERGTKSVVGTYHPTKRGGLVIPRDERFGRNVHTPRPSAELHVQSGQFVVAEITEWTPGSEALVGRVTEVLGEEGSPGIDITVIIREAGVEPDFPAEVQAQSEAISSGIPDDEIARRTDFRGIATFTMDGATAKDFDDALSIERTPPGHWRLGVHIADVAHYVVANTPLDLEAYGRATSIYPIDRVVPMLPEKLSNDLCSLRPLEDRLVMSCVMDIDERGRVHEYSIHEGIIRSGHRLVYEEVQELMDGRAPAPLVRAIGDIRPELEELYRLRAVLTAMRHRRGALDLDIPELEILFNSDGTVKALDRRSREESHRVVEECMLIANEVVASHLFNLHVPAVYRVHEDPDTDKLRRLMPVLAHFGVRFPAKKDITPEAIQAALDTTAKIEGGFIARRLILQAMMRAHYHDENLGHYGLASECYTHFTSPIRRYPDLMVHRLLKECALAGAPMRGIYNPPKELPRAHGEADRDKVRISTKRRPPLAPERIAYLRDHLPQWTKHCSERERRADEIERDAAAVKSLEYMRQFIGEEFDGLVISVLNWGFFVELSTIPVEGLVHVRNMAGDYYDYDEERMMLVGQRSGATIKLGDKVRVAVQNVNVAQLELDFVLVEKPLSSETKAAQTTRHSEKKRREERHTARQPKKGGFQTRGRRRGKR